MLFNLKNIFMLKLNIILAVCLLVSFSKLHAAGSERALLRMVLQYKEDIREVQTRFNEDLVAIKALAEHVDSDLQRYRAICAVVIPSCGFTRVIIGRTEEVLVIIKQYASDGDHVNRTLDSVMEAIAQLVAIVGNDPYDENIEPQSAKMLYDIAKDLGDKIKLAHEDAKWLVQSLLM